MHWKWSSDSSDNDFSLIAWIEENLFSIEVLSCLGHYICNSNLGQESIDTIIILAVVLLKKLSSWAYGRACPHVSATSGGWFLHEISFVFNFLSTIDWSILIDCLIDPSIKKCFKSAYKFSFMQMATLNCSQYVYYNKNNCVNEPMNVWCTLYWSSYY